MKGKDYLYTLINVTGSGYVKYMASPFFYMTTCLVLLQLKCHVQVK